MAKNYPKATFSTRTISRRSLFRGSAVAGVGALGLLAVGCGDDDDTLERIQEEGYVTIGIANEAPYGHVDEAGETVGQAPTVAREVFNRMGIEEMVTVVVPFGSLIPGLQAGRFDIISAGMFITPDRCEQILFSDPDYCVPQALGVEAGNPFGLNSFEDIAANPEVRLGMPSGVIEEDYALAAGVDPDQFVFFDDLIGAGEALAAGRVDAIAATSLAIDAEIARLDDPGLEATPAFEVVIDGEPQSGCGGYGFRTDDEDFRDAFNDVLAQMKQDGEIRPLVEEFGFTDEVDAAVDRTAEELCEA
jgi:polar amino acid transport system substrate-binding protein